VSISRILLQGSVSTNLFHQMRHQMDLRNVEVGIKLCAHIYLVADISPQGIQFELLLGWCLSFRICFLIYLLLVQVVRCQEIGIGLRLLASLPEFDNIFEGVKIVQGVLQVAQCCIIMRSISIRHIAFEQCPCALNCLIECGILSWASAS